MTPAVRSVSSRRCCRARTRERYIDDTRAEYARIAAAHARSEENKQRLSLADARANALKLNWSGNYRAAEAAACSARARSRISRSRSLIDYIDWTPFFATWELNGKYPAILDDATVGEAARSLFADAQEMLEQIVAERWFRASAVIGLWPANSEGDDILVFADEARAKPVATLHTLRQQLARREGRANVALADFVAPRASGLADYIGAFAVTAGIGEDRPWPTVSSTPTTIIPRSWPRRWPTAWPKPSPSACISACARNSGATPPTRRSAPTS